LNKVKFLVRDSKAKETINGWVVGFFHFLEDHWASIEIGVVVATL